VAGHHLLLPIKQPDPHLPGGYQVHPGELQELGPGLAHIFSDKTRNVMEDKKCNIARIMFELVVSDPFNY
jgi:hypothetical protein